MSVVVPTYDRPARLGRLLDGLRAQTLDGERFEVIVVTDGSPPATVRRLEEERRRGGLQLRIVGHPHPRGPAAARNTGWQAARAALVGFTDDDCVPAPQWLAAGVAAARPGTIVQGVTEPDPAEATELGLLSRTVRVDSLGPQYETCNIFYPRAILEALGGFDEGYGLTPGGEDTDLAWRAIDAGYEPVLARDALVRHAVERLGAGGMLRVAARWSSPMRMFAEHSQARAMLYRGLFWNVWHYLLWRSVAALLAPAWLRRVVLTLHLVQLRRRALSARSGSWAIPFLLLHDVVECWAVARGAIRYRTPVL